jgi:hypothetical protein
MSVKHGAETGQRAVASDFAEVTLGFEHSRGGPAQKSWFRLASV